MILNDDGDQYDRDTESIHIGGVFASMRPTIVRTVLGSCISVCLRDPIARIGGMNHYMLPTGGAGEIPSPRYGEHSIPMLLEECLMLGAHKRRIEAKVFGGGHVLKISESEDNVPKQNIRFALKYLESVNIPIVAKDVGGRITRSIKFTTDTGRVQLHRMDRSTDSDADALISMLNKAMG